MTVIITFHFAPSIEVRYVTRIEERFISLDPGLELFITSEQKGKTLVTAYVASSIESMKVTT